jgi:hypothetical protein
VLAGGAGRADDGRVPTGTELPPADVLENLPEPFWWQRRWAGLSARGRRSVVAGVVLALVAGGALWWHDRVADRELRQRVVLATTLGVWTSSTSPPGGAVGWFVLVRNDGQEPLTVTSLDAAAGGLTVTALADGDRLVPPGREVEVPVSVRLTCGATGDGTVDLPAEVGVRRPDGATASRRSELAATLVLDVARTLCTVRPELRDHELSGPVLRPGEAGD